MIKKKPVPYSIEKNFQLELTKFKECVKCEILGEKTPIKLQNYLIRYNIKIIDLHYNSQTIREFLFLTKIEWIYIIVKEVKKIKKDINPYVFTEYKIIIKDESRSVIKTFLKNILYYLNLKELAIENAEIHIHIVFTLNRKKLF